MFLNSFQRFVYTVYTQNSTKSTMTSKPQAAYHLRTLKWIQFNKLCRSVKHAPGKIYKGDICRVTLCTSSMHMVETGLTEVRQETATNQCSQIV